MRRKAEGKAEEINQPAIGSEDKLSK